MAKKAKYPHLLGSKWTAMLRTWGWRHFQVINRKNEAGFVFAELAASCDRNTRFWVNAKALKDRNQWRPGWKSLAEQAELAPDPDWDDLIEPCPLETSSSSSALPSADRDSPHPANYPD
jgi:tryptophan-rich hypothetical protein